MFISIIPQLNNTKDEKKWNVSGLVRKIMLLVLTSKLSILIKILEILNVNLDGSNNYSGNY